MNKKGIWLTTSVLVAAALVLSSCGEGATTTTAPGTTAPTTGPTTTAPSATTVAPDAKVPKYGGTMTTAIASDPTAWDPTKAQAIRVRHMQFTSNELMQGDWTKGPQGTNKETNWDYGFLGDITKMSGELAEKWEMPDPETIIYKIRQDAKWFKNPKAAANGVVNGRAVTAQDVVWNIDYQFNYPGVWQSMSYPPGNPARPTGWKALDKTTVEVKVPLGAQDIMLLEIGDNLYSNPPECWQSGRDMTNWQNIIGSGPWILDDYVSGSSMTYRKNPDYYETDMNHAGNTLPYADSVRELVIPDLATRLTALRTGKIDWLSAVSHDDAIPLINQYKDLQSYKRIATTWVLSGRLDKESLPFKDIRVRRAMNLAVDQKAILRDYMKGDGELLAYPYPPGPDWSKYYTPMEQLPAETQELWTYNPDKAKELLTEAGYPNGFRTKVQVWSQQPQPDEAAMLKDYLSKVGIQLDIQVLEVGAWNSMDAANTHDEMWYGQAKGIWAPWEMLMTKKGMYSNDAIIDDPYYVGVMEAIGKNMVSNPEAYFAKLKEAGVYELSSAWAIWMPSPYQYALWWPWFQNYYGINWTGWANVWGDNTKYFWMDTNMKKQMGF